MRATSYDVAIIGGGHNGLVCAAYLAKAGASVIVLEKNAVAGGAAATEEFHPGFRNSVAAYTVSLLDPKVIRDLELTRHGLRIVERPAANFWPLEDGRHLLMPYGLTARQAAIAQFSTRDAERLPAFEAALARAAAILRDLVLATPPNAGSGIAEIVRAAPLARRLAKLPLTDQRLITDLFTRSVADVLDRWFESGVVKAALAFDGIVGVYASPYTPGTAYVLLHHCFGEVNGRQGQWGHAIGGMGAIADAMRSAAEAAGAVVRTSAPVAEVLMDGDRAAGVRLASGETIRTRVVAANVGPKLLVRDLVPADAIEPEVRDRFLAIKTGSGTFRMNVALSQLPDFTCLPSAEDGSAGTHHGSGIVIGPGIGYLDRAFTDTRHAGWSLEPIIEMLIPSTQDETLAPPGRHVASLFVQHVAPRLEDVEPIGGDIDMRLKNRFRPLAAGVGPGRSTATRSWTDPREKEAFADLVIDTLTRYAPNFRSSVIARQVLSPLDLEHRFGMLDGDISHGQMSLDQLFSLRPILGHANYRMPVKGLYLCGAGAHPGGGVTGAAGHNAAREIMGDLKREPPWLR
jgi:phytoene dehydrogenase-like protein